MPRAKGRSASAPAKAREKLPYEKDELSKVRQLRSSKPGNRKSRAYNQESENAKGYQDSGYVASRVYASGRIPGMPGDIQVEDLLLGESKQTRTGRLVIDPNWISKIEKQAKDMGKRSWIIHAWVASGNENFTKVVILPEDTWYNMIKR